MKQVILFMSACLFLINAMGFASEEMNSINKLVDKLQNMQSTQETEPFANQIDLVNGSIPYSFIYEPSGLFEWQLFNKCYFDFRSDTSSTIRMEIDYLPIDDFFPNLPSFFHFVSEKPYASLDGFTEKMQEEFQALGDSYNYEILINEPDSSYGNAGQHYVQSFFSGGTELVLDSYFVMVENTACAVYYITDSYYYGNFIYQLSFESTLYALHFNPTTTIEQDTYKAPAVFKLNQNYPNPFNNSTRIQYKVPETQMVTLEVFDSNGRLVKALVKSNQAQGEYTANFDADGLASGIYFYKLTSGKTAFVQKMTLVK